MAVRPQEQAFGSFIKVSSDGRVTVAIPQVETGQGIWSGLAQIVADELGAAWDMIGVEPAPPASIYRNPMSAEEGWPDHLMITAASTSVRAFERPLRDAAAIARSMLIGAAADRWGIGPDKCDTADGLVISSVKTLSFGELAEEAAARTPPRSAPLRQASKGRLISSPLPRLDGPAKARGSWRFASDVRLPELLFASIRMAPPNGQLRSFSRAAVERSPGVRHLSANSDWLAIVADNWWQAEQAIKKADAKFTTPREIGSVREPFDAALASVAVAQSFKRGNYASAIVGSRPLTATYFAAPSMHLQLEPVSATARIGSNGVEVWAASQVSKAGDDGSWVRYPMPSGDPAGRAFDVQAVPIAADLARAVGRPVQLIFSQSSGQNHDHVSPGAIARLSALPGSAGVTDALAMKVATVDSLGAALDRISGARAAGLARKSAMDGAIPPYAIPHLLIEGAEVPIPYSAGYMRGSPQREFVFFIESFVDELARAAGVEPLAFRMSMLGGNPRLARCFQAAAALAGWDGGARGSTMGIAGASAFGSNIALVATASLDDRGKIVARRLVAAVDCGRTINRNLVEQQVSGALIWALGQATVPQAEWVAAMPRARPIGGIDLPRLRDAPEIVIDIIQSPEEPGGISGLGTLPLAPALANAVHAGSGIRLRSLPFVVDHK